MSDPNQRVERRHAAEDPQDYRVLLGLSSMIVLDDPGGSVTEVVRTAVPGKTRGRIQVGADDPSLTGAGGMLAVTELSGKLGLIAALDAGMGPVKQRRRGFTGGQVLAGMAAAQLAGEGFLVGLDRVRADAAGQLLVPVPGLATSTAAGIARRFTQQHWRGAEAGLAAATARMIGLLPGERAAELAEGPVTIDIDATDVEVYGSNKRGVAYNYQGQRAGRPHVASWAETEIPLAADLLAGDQDPRSHVTGLLGRALAALPRAVRWPGGASGLGSGGDGLAEWARRTRRRKDAGPVRGRAAVRIVRTGVDGGLAGSGDLAGAAAGPGGRAAEYLRLDYCGRLVGEAGASRVRGVSSPVPCGQAPCGLWLAASLCAPLVGGRAERSSL